MWEVLQGSVQGASHKDKDLPNQDSVKVVQPSAGALPIVAVVSDGHGSEPHFRSNAGSRLATERVAQILERFSTVHGEATEEEVKTQAQLLPQRIVEAWRLEVDAHLAEVPLSPEEEAIFNPENPYIPYGATLVSCLITPRFALFVQLGDGEIACLDDDGRAMRPMPEDPLLLGNVTTSLCGPDAERDVRVVVKPLVGKTPKLVLLCSDGYSNCFKDAQVPEDNLRDLSGRISNRGAANVQRTLEDGLNSVSAKYSRDDTTLVLIGRLDPEDPGILPIRIDDLQAMVKTQSNLIEVLTKNNAEIARALGDITKTLMAHSRQQEEQVGTLQRIESTLASVPVPVDEKRPIASAGAGAPKLEAKVDALGKRITTVGGVVGGLMIAATVLGLLFPRPAAAVAPTASIPEKKIPVEAPLVQNKTPEPVVEKPPTIPVPDAGLLGPIVQVGDAKTGAPVRFSMEILGEGETIPKDLRIEITAAGKATVESTSKEAVQIDTSTIRYPDKGKSWDPAKDRTLEFEVTPNGQKTIELEAKATLPPAEGSKDRKGAGSQTLLINLDAA